MVAWWGRPSCWGGEEEITARMGEYRLREDADARDSAKVAVQCKQNLEK